MKVLYRPFLLECATISELRIKRHAATFFRCQERADGHDKATALFAAVTRDHSMGADAITLTNVESAARLNQKLFELINLAGARVAQCWKCARLRVS